MGLYLGSVRLSDGRVVEPVVINSRLHCIGIAVSPALDLVAIDFHTDDVSDINDASEWDVW